MVTKAYTRVGDSGETSLFDGSKIKKDSNSDLLQFLGKLDTTNVAIGQLKFHLNKHVSLNGINFIIEYLNKLQNINMNFMGYVQSPSMIEFNEKELIIELEKNIDDMNKQLPTLTKFILAGDSIEDVSAHYCRVYIRESELYFNSYTSTNENICGKKYLNRLSSYFFTLARYINSHILFIDTEKVHYRK